MQQMENDKVFDQMSGKPLLLLHLFKREKNPEK